MKLAWHELLVVSDNKLMAEVLGGALESLRVVESSMHIRPGTELASLHSMRKLPMLMAIHSSAFSDEDSLYTCLQRVAHEFPDVRVFVLGDENALERAAESIVSGASTFVLSHDSLGELTATVQSLKRGDLRCSTVIIDVILQKIRQLAANKQEEPLDLANELTSRELEVLQLMQLGLLNKEIARQMGIAVSTVKNHIHAIFEKLGVDERRVAIRRGIALGLLHCQEQGLLV